MFVKKKCGIFVNPENPIALAEKIIYLQNQPKVKEQMGINARELAIKMFDKDLLCNQVSGVIKQFQNKETF